MSTAFVHGGLDQQSRVSYTAGTLLAWSDTMQVVFLMVKAFLVADLAKALQALSEMNSAMFELS